MKIICVGRNYADHAKELNNTVPTEPVIFMKPDSALLVNNKPFYLPDFSEEIHHELELVIKINRLGKHIDPKFAHRYYNEITVGIDFTARDLQNKFKNAGNPWELAKGFDGSAAIGTFISLDQLENKDQIAFHLLLNNEKVQKGKSSDMLFSIDTIIAFVSKFVTLKMGDIIFTGTPSGVGSVKINDRLTGYIEENKLFDFYIK